MKKVICLVIATMLSIIFLTCCGKPIEVSSAHEDSQEFKNVVVDIDLDDDGYLSTFSDVVIHYVKDSDEIDYITVDRNALLAFDIPEWAGDRIYTLSNADMQIILMLLEDIHEEYPDADIESIIEILTARWYEYTPT